MRRGLVGVLTATISLIFLPEAYAAAPRAREQCRNPERQVILVVVDALSYEEALALRMPIVPGSEAGIGLMTVSDDEELSDLEAYSALGSGGTTSPIRTQCPGIVADLSSRWSEVWKGLLESGGTVGLLDSLLYTSDLLVIPREVPSAEDLAEVVSSSPAEELMLVVAAPVPSDGMRARGDEVTPLIIVSGQPGQLRECRPISRCARGLTSETTRRNGIVSNVDVAPTMIDFLNLHAPRMEGSPIRIEGEPPTGLHQRYLQYQRIHTPVGLLALAVALITLFVSTGVLLARRTTSPTVAKLLGILALVSVALPVVMLPASLLPRLTYAFLLPTLAAGAVLVAVAALRWGLGDPARTIAVVAGLGLGVVILDGLFGWSAMMMPLLGDGALGGVRFYGMGNAYAGVYMAGAILLAAGIPPVAGMGLLAAAGLLAGLPNFGAELGTSFTLFVAAGLWYLFRVRRRFTLRELGIAAAVALVGLAAILLIHAISPVPTHVTRVVEDSPGNIIATFGRRLALNVRNTSATPVAWLIVALLPVWLLVAWKRLGPFRTSLRNNPVWRDAVVVLALCAMIGFLVNDSIGVTGLGFTFLSAALIYPALRERWTISA